MTLIERIETLRKRAGDQIFLEKKRAESTLLQPLLDDARALSEDLSREIEQLRLLKDQGIDVAAPDSAAMACKTLGRLRERFAKENRAEQLTRGRDWGRLNDQIEETCKSLATALRAEWRRVVETAFSGDKPNNLENTLARTAGNERNLQRYREVYGKLNQLSGYRPTERSDFDNIRILARQLKEIHQDFDFNVPDDVKLFLGAVAVDGADLALLTAEVRDWLKQQNTSDHYRIVARE